MQMPPLAFGQADALMTKDAERASQRLADVVPSMRMRPLGSSREFGSRTAVRKVGDIRLMAHAATACVLDVEETHGWHMMVPHFGAASLKCDGHEYRLRSGTDALLLPNMQRRAERPTSSAVMIALDIVRLSSTMSGMCGMDDYNPGLADRPFALNLERNRALFPAFLQICGMIDATRGQGKLAQQLGIDDMIYRWIATSMCGGCELSRANDGGDRVNARVDLVCGLVRSSVDRPLTLSEMEQASGLSARSLQYAFQSRFNCSPMEWQRHERMLTAQRRVMSARGHETITDIAYALGFSSSAAFATLYKRYFSETPSQTRKRYR